MKTYFALFFSLFSFALMAQDVAILKYKGGGDWYSNPTALPNLIAYSNKNLKMNIFRERLFQFVINIGHYINLSRLTYLYDCLYTNFYIISVYIMILS